MHFRYSKTLVAVGAVAAMAFPAVSAAKGGHGHGHNAEAVPGHGHGHKNDASQGHHQRGRHARSLIVVGTVSAVGTDGTVQVDVTHANHHGAGLVGQTVTFDVSNARIVVADVNGDGSRDLSDVAVGDHVLLRARVAKGENPDPTATITARGLVDKGPAANAGSGDTSEQPSGSTDSGGSTDSTQP